MTTSIDVVTRTAVISPCLQHRYRLGRRWSAGEPMVFVMLNPSTADAFIDDPTIRRCMGFAEREGYSGIEVVNLFSFRATSPKILAQQKSECRNGPEWERHIREACQLSTMIVMAWGANKIASQSPVLSVLQDMPVVHCLSVTADGSPGHPLYLPATAKPKRYTL